MKEVLTIHHADNGIIIKYDEYVEVVEYTHNADGKGTWASNPYVFVYEFELIK